MELPLPGYYHWADTKSQRDIQAPHSIHDQLISPFINHSIQMKLTITISPLFIFRTKNLVDVINTFIQSVEQMAKHTGIFVCCTVQRKRIYPVGNFDFGFTNFHKSINFLTFFFYFIGSRSTICLRRWMSKQRSKKGKYKVTNWISFLSFL